MFVREKKGEKADHYLKDADKVTKRQDIFYGKPLL